MALPKNLRDALTVLRRDGFAYVRHSQTKHWKVVLERDGIQITTIISNTASDGARWLHNVRKCANRSWREKRDASNNAHCRQACGQETSAGHVAQSATERF